MSRNALLLSSLLLLLTVTSLYLTAADFGLRSCATAAAYKLMDLQFRLLFSGHPVQSENSRGNWRSIELQAAAIKQRCIAKFVGSCVPLKWPVLVHEEVQREAEEAIGPSKSRNTSTAEIVWS